MKKQKIFGKGKLGFRSTGILDAFFYKFFLPLAAVWLTRCLQLFFSSGGVIALCIHYGHSPNVHHDFKVVMLGL